ncbi:MAG: hypothetical protein R3B95_02885 [Nitrospirales bacterium]|nr:hypothetical protein [Nitrospirales bacterium]
MGTGSSPRLRGTSQGGPDGTGAATVHPRACEACTLAHVVPKRRRFIPAPAGNMGTLLFLTTPHAGSSPRLREHHNTTLPRQVIYRFIPAPARTPQCPVRIVVRHGSSPRCGNTHSIQKCRESRFIPAPARTYIVNPSALIGARFILQTPLTNLLF